MDQQQMLYGALVLIIILIIAYYGYKYWEKRSHAMMPLPGMIVPPKSGFHGGHCPYGCPHYSHACPHGY